MPRLGSFYLIAVFWGSSGLFSQSNEEFLNKLFSRVVSIRVERVESITAKTPNGNSIPSTSFGSGLLIAGNRILTNAHVINNAKLIRFKKYNEEKYYLATTKFVGFDCDLAVLEPESGFSSEDDPIEIATENPKLGTDLLILGYPEGRETLSVEKANVISIERNRYTFTGLDFRNVIRVNSYVKPGNSGGPAIQGEKVVGLTFQFNSLNDRVGYLIPSEIILHFLKDIADNRYDGFPSPPFSFQNGNSSSAKAYFKIPEGITGIFINAVYPGSTFSEVLQEKDFVFQIDDFKISNEGQPIPFQGESILDYIEKKQVGESIRIYFIRGDKAYEASAVLVSNSKFANFRNPSEEVFSDSGLVFQKLDKSFFLEDVNQDSLLKYRYSYHLQDKLYNQTSEEIVLTNVKEESKNPRAVKYKNKLIYSINDVPVKNFSDLKTLWKRFETKTLVLRFKSINLPLILSPSLRLEINNKLRYLEGQK